MCVSGNNGIILLYGIRTVKNSNLLYTQRVKLKKKTIKKIAIFLSHCYTWQGTLQTAYLA